MIEPGLAEKHALVTGGNHGIGAATARALAAQGVNVFIQYLRVPPPEGAMASETRAYHLGQAATADAVVAALEIDLADPAHVSPLLDHAQAAFGPVDILVNNAADAQPDTFVPQPDDLADRLPQLSSSAPVSPISPDTIERHFAVNTRAVALLRNSTFNPAPSITQDGRSSPSRRTSSTISSQGVSTNPGCQ